jgi:hypothetical protein
MAAEDQSSITLGVQRKLGGWRNSEYHLAQIGCQQGAAVGAMDIMLG